MNKWKTKINLDDLFDSYDNGQLSFEKMREEVIARLRANSFASAGEDEEDFEKVIDEFVMAGDEEEFDYAMTMLYDFGDEGKRIWIEGMI